MNDSAATVLLAGCGDVGTALGLRLAERGVRAVGVRRRADALPEPLEPVSLDLTDPGEAVLPVADAVVVTLTADGRDATAYERTYLGALRGLHLALPSDAAPRVVLVSSTGVLSGTDGEVVTEATPPDPQRATAHVLLAAEELAADLFPDLVIVRPAGIYGPGRTSLIERVRTATPVTHRRVTNRIHRDDLVTVLSTVLDAPEPPRLLHAVDHDAAQLGDVVTHLDTQPRERGRSARSSTGRSCTPWFLDPGGATPPSGRGTTRCWERRRRRSATPTPGEPPAMPPSVTPGPGRTRRRTPRPNREARE